MSRIPSPLLIEKVPFPDNGIMFPPFAAFPSAGERPNLPRNENRILIAEDDAVSSEILTTWLQKWGYEPVVTANGAEAMTVMRSPAAPALVVLDWMMPGMDGLEVCRRLREISKVVYIILLTSRGRKEGVVEGLQAGADDYLVKPFDPLELQARIHVGFRIINLQKELSNRLAELAAAAEELSEAKASMMPL